LKAELKPELKPGPKKGSALVIILRYLAIGLAISIVLPANSDPLKIAVASNFKSSLVKLVNSGLIDFDHEVRISSGATGSIYTQIINGAPFDVFLAADTERPLLLEKNNLISPGSRKIYAIGQLVLWVPGANTPVDEQYLQLFTGNLAIANPKTAPYGFAALSLLEHLNIDNPRIITGENIAQAYQFVHTGNAQAGLVALSQIVDQGIEPFFYWQVPQHYYKPIEQQMVILNSSPASIEFMDYLVSEPARNIISASGYQVPGNHNRD
jgi:molybdate transport system substrate-binding protein